MPQTHKMNRIARGRGWLLTCTVAGAAILLAACGSSSSTTSSSAGSVTSSAAGGANVSKAKAVAAQAANPQSFVAPGPAFKAASAKGKVMYDIPASSTIPFVASVVANEQAIAKQYGVKYVAVNNSGTPSAWAAGVRQAINAHADLIDLNEMEPAEVGASVIQAAEKAGIKVIGSIIYPDNTKPPLGLWGVSTQPYAEQSTIMAANVVAESGGSASTLFEGETLEPSSPLLANSFKSEYLSLCPQCKITSISMPFTDWATKLEGATETALNQNPGVNWVVPVYDSMMQFAGPGIEAAGRAAKVKVASQDGTPFVVKQIATGNPSYMISTVAIPGERMAYATMDLAFRALAGQSPTATSKVAPINLTKPNAVSGLAAYTKDYIAGYEKLWSGQ